MNNKHSGHVVGYVNLGEVNDHLLKVEVRAHTPKLIFEDASRSCS